MIGLAAVLKPFRNDAALEHGLHHLLDSGFRAFETMPCDGFADKLTLRLKAHVRLIKINVPLPSQKVDDRFRQFV